jgi:hypothetical protein
VVPYMDTRMHALCSRLAEVVVASCLVSLGLVGCVCVCVCVCVAVPTDSSYWVGVYASA